MKIASNLYFYFCRIENFIKNKTTSVKKKFAEIGAIKKNVNANYGRGILKKTKIFFFKNRKKGYPPVYFTFLGRRYWGVAFFSME